MRSAGRYVFDHRHEVVIAGSPLAGSTLAHSKRWYAE